MSQVFKGKGRIGVIGPGLMGSGITQVCAASGYDVLLYGRHDDKLKSAFEKISASYERNLARGKISAEEKTAAENNIKTVTELDTMGDRDIIIEAVSEDMDLKKKIFGQLNEICPKDTIFATNTSALSISEIGRASGRPDRFLGTHFFNPVHAMALVEIVRGEDTGSETLDTVKAFVSSLGKTGVVVTDTPGFLVNRVLYAFRLEAMRCLQEGVAGVEDIDTAVKLALGHPMGPFELNDFSGLDVSYSAMSYLCKCFNDERWKPNPLLEELVQAGELGRKTGKGWYDYTSGEKKPRSDRSF